MICLYAVKSNPLLSRPNRSACCWPVDHRGMPRVRLKVTSMSGLLILISCWVASGEILPAPKNATASISSERSGPTTSERLPPPKSIASSSPAKLVTTSTEAASASFDQIGAETCKIGWGTDKSDGTMYMVVQIAPEAIAAFAAGDRGQELPCDVPPGLRSRISKVIVRIGNGVVERDPPESELAMLPLPTNPNSNARIANLDLKSQTPVNVDAPRSTSSIVPTASTSQIPGVTGALPSTTGEVFPSGIAPAIVPNPIATNPVLPSTTASSNLGAGTALPTTSSPTAYNAAGGTLGTYPTTSASTSSTAWNNNTPSLPSTTTYSNDGFSPPKTVPTTLNPFGSSRTSTTLPSTSSTQGNVTYNGTNNAAVPTAGYSNTYGNVPLVANNGAAGGYPPGNNGLVLPNDPNGYHAANGGTHHMTNPGFNGNFAATQPTYTGQPFNNQHFNNHQQAMTNPVLPIPQLANRPLPSTSGSTITTASLPGGYVTGNRDDQLQSDRNGSINAKAGSLVPFFLVLSFILNVYFGLWLNHLSIKYRHLLGSLRGLTPAEMDR